MGSKIKTKNVEKPESVPTVKKSKSKKKREAQKLKSLVAKTKEITKQKKPMATSFDDLKKPPFHPEDEENLKVTQKVASVKKTDLENSKTLIMNLDKGQRMTLRGVCHLKVISGTLNVNSYQAPVKSEMDLVCPDSGCMQINISVHSEPASFELSTVDNGFTFLSLYPEFQNTFAKNENRLWSSDEDLYVRQEPRVENFVSEALQTSLFKNKRLKLSVCGSKNSGKSTASLFTANYLLSQSNVEKILWLDVDVGQPEFTLPGSVSLLEIKDPVFGPHFCHMRKPVRSIFVGTISMADALVMYFSAVESLIDFVTGNYSKNVPLLFNMPGWIEVGLGFEITSNLLRILQPTHTVQFIVNDTNVVEMTAGRVSDSCNLRSDCNLGSVHYDLLTIYLERAHKSTKSANAPKERQLRCLTYFHQLLPGKNLKKNLSKKALTLLDLPRQSVSMVGKILEVVPTNRSLNPSLILMAFNLTVVAFCKLEPGAHIFEPTPVNDGDFYVANDACQKRNRRIVVGYGIVTEINKETLRMSVVTDLSDEDLRKCPIISKGSLPVPQCALLNEKSKFWKIYETASKDQLPPYVTNFFPRHLNASGMASRRVFQPSA